jgi:hypothetical protein
MISFLSIMLYSSLVSFGQISSVYSLDNISGGSSDCCIYFYKNGVYEIFIEEQETDDLISVLIISYGNYTYENRHLILYDLYNGYQMRFIYRDSYIVSIRAFKCLLNKKFLKNNFQIWDDPDSTYNFAKNVKQKREEFKQMHKVEYTFKTGIYEADNGFTLTIKSENQYLFCYNGIILSEGKWDRDGNELVLADSDLQYTFYILIEKEFLKCLILPGEHNIFTFHK